MLIFIASDGTDSFRAGLTRSLQRERDPHAASHAKAAQSAFDLPGGDPIGQVGCQPRSACADGVADGNCPAAGIEARLIEVQLP